MKYSLDIKDKRYYEMARLVEAVLIMVAAPLKFMRETWCSEGPYLLVHTRSEMMEKWNKIVFGILEKVSW
jgi:hypothetical protein